MKLSIVIPVYNVEQTLRRCVESIRSQSFRNWQMILVNDASTDNSEAICKDYAEKDGRIQTMTLGKNRGLSEARNKGILKARGNYITFVDSDDYLGPETLKDVMEELNIHPDYDILEYPAFKHYGSKHQRLLKFPRKEYTDMAEYWLKGKAYTHTYAWNKIYRRELFDNVWFPVGKNFEDVWALPRLLKKCNVVATTDVGLYYYCYNPNGITSKASSVDFANHLKGHIIAINELCRESDNNSLRKDLKGEFAEYYAAVFNIMLDFADASHHPFESEFFKDGPYSFPKLPYNQTFKLKLFHLLGLKHVCQLHRLFHRVH